MADKPKTVKRKSKSSTTEEEKRWTERRTALTDDGREVHIPDEKTEQFICEDCNTINTVNPDDPDSRKCRSAVCEARRHARAMAKGVHPVAGPDHRAPHRDEGREDAKKNDSDEAPVPPVHDDKKPAEPSQAKKPKTAGFALGQVYACQTDDFKLAESLKYPPKSGFVGKWWAHIRLHPTDRKQRDMVVGVEEPRDGKVRLFSKIAQQTGPAIVRLPPIVLGGATESGLLGHFYLTVNMDEKEKARKLAENLLAMEINKAKCTYHCPVPPVGENPDWDAFRAWQHTIDRMAAQTAVKNDPNVKLNYDAFVTNHALHVKEENRTRKENHLPPMTPEEQADFTFTAWMKTGWKPTIHEPKIFDDAKRENALEKYGTSESFYVSHYVTSHYETGTPDADALSNPTMRAVLCKLRDPSLVHPDADAEAKLSKWIVHPENAKKEKMPLYPNILPCRDDAGSVIPWSKRPRIGPGCVVVFDVSYNYVPPGKSPAHLIMNVHAIRVIREASGRAQDFDENVEIEAIAGATGFKGSDDKSALAEIAGVMPLPALPAPAPAALLPAPDVHATD